MKKILIIPFILCISISLAFSQKLDSTKTVKITLKDDNEIIGRVIAKDSVSMTVRSISGVVSVIPNSQVVEVKTVKGQVIGQEYFHQDPADTRLLLLPTGRGLKAGEVQFNDIEIFFPHLQIGATDYFSVGVGGLPFVASGGGGTLVYYASAKLTPLNKESAAFSLGGAFIGTTSSTTIVGITYAVGTFGDNQGSVTLGPFIAFSSDNEFKRPALLLGGQTRTSKSVTLLTENIFIFGNETEDFVCFPSVGIRFSGEKIAADFGTYAVITKSDFFYPIPWIGFTYKF